MKDRSFVEGKEVFARSEDKVQTGKQQHEGATEQGAIGGSATDGATVAGHV